MVAYTIIHTNTHKERKSLKAPYPCMRPDVKRLFSLGKPKKKGEALPSSRASLLVVVAAVAVEVVVAEIYIVVVSIVVAAILIVVVSKVVAAVEVKVAVAAMAVYLI